MGTAAVRDVYTFGAEKYAPNTWQKLENGYERYKAAMFRHVLAHEQGEMRDRESGLPHLAHAAWNALAMLYFGLKDKGYEGKNDNHQREAEGGV